MAEVVGLAASIIQIAGAGAKLSVALYNFTNSAARADQDVKDIADDVELTSNALESVGRVFESEEAGSIVSKKAIQDANNIIKKCQSVFHEVSEMVEKRRKTAKDGKKSLSVMGKLAWPMKEQRVELNRRRLESLKNSLVLLLHVLQLAQGQARGKMEKGVLDEEREKIRELHQRQQDSLKSLQALENRFCHIAINDEETLRGSSVASCVPTLELMANAPVMELPPLEKVPKLQPNTITIELSTPNDSDTSDSDATVSGDDNQEQISTEELAKAADHVKKLLKRITMLQKSFDVDKKKHRKRHVYKIYQRFCRKFESGIKLPSAVDFGKVAPFIDFNMDDNGGQLESFDFDSFLHVDDENTQFPLDGFYFSQGQRAVSQQTTNLDAIPSTQSSQYPPLVSHESVETVPSFDAQTPHYPPVPSGSAASDFPLDLSGQQQRPSLGQGHSALAQQTPEALSQTWAQIQRQAQSMVQQQAQAQSMAQQQAQAQSMAQQQAQAQFMAQQQAQAQSMVQQQAQAQFMAQQQAQAQHQKAQAQHQQAQAQRHQAHWQHQQAHSQAAMQPMSGMIQSPPSPAMPMLNRPMLSPVSTSSPSMPIYSRIVIPAISQSSQSRVESSLHNQSPTLTADSTLLPQPPSPNTVLRDYQYQLMFLDCRKRKSNPPSEQGQYGNNQLMADNSMTESIPMQSEKSERQDPQSTLQVYGWPGVRKRANTNEEKRAPTPGRAFTEQQKRNAVQPCNNCHSLKLKCDYNYPCGSCITRNVEKEYLSEKTCRGINIAEHAQGLPTEFENTGQQLGVPVPPSSSLYTTSGSSSSSKSHKNPPVIHDGGGKIYDPNISTSAPDGGEYDTSSGYVEPEAEESYLSRAKSLKPNVGRVGDQKRSRSPSDVRTGLSWPPPAALRFSTDDGTEQDADQRSPRKRRRLAKEENEQFSKNTADIMSKLEDDEQMTETGNISISVDRDIVDVLLEEWTVPVY